MTGKSQSLKSEGAELSWQRRGHGPRLGARVGQVGPLGGKI